MAIFGWFVTLALALPSWNILESKLPSVSPPVFDQSLPDESIQSTKPVLYRDKDAICPYSEQVWLALEVKNIDYATVLVSSSSTKSPLQLTWPDGTIQTNSLDIIEKIQQEYPHHPPNLYPKGISECLDAVRCNIVRLKGVFPRRTDDNNSPYLFLENGGGLVSDSNLMVTLEETDEVLEEYFQGPFLCGKDFTAADVVWAPFLERFAVQLPCLHPGKPELHPRDGGEYDALQEWYQVMESTIPCYSCRVQGNVHQWKRALELGIQQYNQEHDANVALPDDDNLVDFAPHEMDANALWKKYSENRPWLAATPEEQCVAYLVRNRREIARDACKELSLDEDNVDTALREVIAVLLDKDSTGEKLSGNARDLAVFVRDGIAVPRDMGMIPAASLEHIVERAPAPRIA